MRMTEDIIPLTELRARLTRTVERLDRGDGCVIVTRNGRPAVVMLSPREFDRLCYESFVRAKLAAGLADAARERTRAHRTVMAEARKRADASPDD
jgi:prevent-host-death family protein